MGAALFFGLSVVLGKTVAANFAFPTIYLGTALISFTAPVFLSTITSRIKSLRALGRRDLLWLVVYVAFGYGIPMYCILESYKLSNVANIAFLLKTDSLFALLTGQLVLREKPRWFQVTGLPVMLTGVFMLTGAFIGHVSWSSINYFALIAAVCWGISYIPARILLKRGVDSISLAMLKQSLNLPAAILVFLFFFRTYRYASEANLWNWVVLFIYSLTPFVFAHCLLNSGLRILPAWQASSLLLTDSLFATLFASLFYHETPSGPEWVGGFLILVGSLVAGMKNNRPKERRSLDRSAQRYARLEQSNYQ